MHVITITPLRSFWENKDYADSEQPLRTWYAEVKKAKWKNWVELKRKYATASPVGSNAAGIQRIVFNIGGNKYRLVVWVKYATEKVDGTIADGTIYVRWVNTHKKYDRTNVEEL